jgi:endonuclease I
MVLAPIPARARGRRAFAWTILVAASSIAFAPRFARADPPPGYYDGVDASTSQALFSTLHPIIDDHVRIPYSSAGVDTWDVLEAAQEDPSDPGRILDVYRNASYAKVGAGNAFYDREHTWPRSYGFPNDGASNQPFSDCHLLHLSHSSYNNARGNNPYGTCDAACTVAETVANAGQGGGSGPYPDDDNWIRGAGGAGGLLGRFETWTGRRGDVARAILYADVRYEGGLHGVTGFGEPDLIVTDDETLIAQSNTGANELVAYMGLRSTLLEWHALDPVDAFERRRNDVVFAFQGNRNPFVDHPEWVAVAFGETGPECSIPADCDDGLFCNGVESCSGGGSCQSGTPPCAAPLSCNESLDVCSAPPAGAAVWINEIHYDNAGTDAGEFFELAGSAGLSLTGWSIVAYNGSNGAPYATVPLVGTLPDQAGCAGALSFPLAGLQNGSPDGLALLDAEGAIVEFLSYEGTFTALSGPASGRTSVDIGVAEPSDSPIGFSLGRAGSGSAAASFPWQPPAVSSPGLLNAGQTVLLCSEAEPVPSLSPGAGAGLLALLVGVAGWRAQRSPSMKPNRGSGIGRGA